VRKAVGLKPLGWSEFNSRS